MKIVLLVLGALAALILLFIVWRIYATIAGGRRAYLNLAARIAPVAQALDTGREPSGDDLLTFARNRETRKVLFDLLEQRERLALFPAAFRTWEAMAEADLVAWLCHPNELGSAPDEIELVQRLPAPGDGGYSYFLFRYRMNPPHWAARDGWMAGVAGPYDLSGEPVSSGPGTFSRFEAYDSRRPEEHVLVTHRLVIERKAS